MNMSQTDIDIEIYPDKRIHKHFTQTPSPSREEKAIYLKGEYGISGHSPDKSGNWVSSNSKGMEFRNGDRKINLTWLQIADRIDRLIWEE